MTMNKRKIFSIVIASLALLIIIFAFLPYQGNSYVSISLWSSDYKTIGLGVTQMILLLAVIAVYLLHLFADIKEKWVTYANYAVGFVVFTHLVSFFNLVGGGSAAGFWLEFIFSLGLGTCSVLWYFMSEEPFAKKETTPIIGYDEHTGKPIYAKIKSYDPKTGKPIYEK